MRLASIAALLLAPVLCHAAEPGVPAALTALIGQADHRQALLQAVQSTVGPSPCRDATYATNGEVAILQPLEFDAQGKLVAGVWKETVIETGCGARRALNALSIAGPLGVEVEPLLPGSTITDPQLQRDSVQYAAAAMGGMPAGCETGAVTDTRFDGVDGAPAGTRPVPGGPRLPWTETWTLQACAKRAEVRMQFTPDDTGTAIHSGPATAPAR